jgi:hypothetical protein
LYWSYIYLLALLTSHVSYGPILTYALPYPPAEYDMAVIIAGERSGVVKSLDLDKDSRVSFSGYGSND